MKNNTANTHHRCLNAILNFHGISSDITAVERLPEEDQGRRKVTFKNGELEKIITRINDGEVKDLLYILRYSGMRVGTCIRALKTSIDLCNEQISIPYQINKGKVYSYKIKIDGRIFKILHTRMIDKELAWRVYRDFSGRDIHIYNSLQTS